MPTSPAKSNPQPSSDDAPATCRDCPQVHRCRAAWSAPLQGPFSAAGLALSSALAFLLPLIGAASAGILLHTLHTGPAGFSFWVILAAVVGFLGGAALAYLIIPSIQKHFPAH